MLDDGGEYSFPEKLFWVTWSFYIYSSGPVLWEYHYLQSFLGDTAMAGLIAPLTSEPGRLERSQAGDSDAQLR